MKTVTQIEEASLSSGLETTAMGMVLNATSFNHIINSLYKNPLGAIIRELTTNALESHMVAKTTRKVAIQLPTAYDQNFIIRDFGTGLDDAEVQKYLNTLFSTSKDKDNNLMGGFGLGSKSPLALVDTFNIISIKNGLKNNYSWIKEPGKLPSLVYLDDEEDRNERTKEDDGIKIVIPLGSSTKLSQSSLQSSVEKEARRQLLGFAGKFMFVDNIHTPHYTDLKDITETVIKEKLVLDLEHVALFKRDPDTYYPDSQTMLIMIGGVNYPFTDSYRTYVRSLFKYFVNAQSEYIVCLKAPIGSLELPMSREEILTTAQNEKVLELSANQAAIDIAEHIKSLNIDLNVSLAQFYKQLTTITSNLSNSNGVQFNLEISQKTFEDKDKKLNDFYLKLKALPNSSYGGTQPLQVRQLLCERLPTRLLQEFTGTNALSFNVYDKFGNREKCSHGYSTNISSKNYSYLVTTSPLPAGVSHNLLHKYATDKLKIKHDLIVIQVDDSLHKDFENVFEVIQSHSEYFLGSSSEYLGTLDVKAVADFKDELKLANAGTGRASYVRAAVDYIPGARVFDMAKASSYSFNLVAGLLHINLGDSKVNALEDINGKRIPIGPDYIPAGKKVLLVKSSCLPIDLSAYAKPTSQCVHGTTRKIPETFNAHKASLYTPLKDFVVLKVTAASFNSCLERLKDAKIEVFTEDSLFKLPRPTIKDIPPVTLGKNILSDTLSSFTNRLGLWSRSHEYISKTSKDALVKLLPTLISEPIYLTACQEAVASCKRDEDIFRMYSSSLDEYEGYDPTLIKRLAETVATAMIEEVTTSTDSELNKYLFELIGQGLKKEVFNTIIDNLLTVAVKGKTNEIQTQGNSAT